QILKRRTSLGYLTFKGKEYAGNHEPLISEKIFEEAQEEMRRRSVAHTPSQYLLSGLLECGDCGAKMRYQKWGKSVKIVCYSQQTSKKYLIKDPDCRNQKYFAEDVEEAVVQELFRMAYLNDQSMKKTDSQALIADSLKQKISRKQEEIKRLYHVYAEKGSPQLLEVITDREKEIERLRQTLEEENKRSSIALRVERSRELLRDLQKSWKGMSAQDRKNICKQLIDRVVISGADGRPGITVHFNLQEFLLEEQTGGT
ncbi:MAG: recombinase zinc beta ribbon domain-containing protein, partial [Clostridia bacterium]|nr:recombinase zinc beta ribbon domain-containing protein [Clostridia bacterium]